ncbi:MAG TPA: MBL fold metallo-hydrolase [Candidatus Binatia bacterium]|nr:MBL fold metallo-hydrolase [Candidatus Binatia bacterium]
MQKVSSLLFTALISISIIALAHESLAQTGRPAVEDGHSSHHARTAAGPSLRADRAQSSNLLTVNGTHYVVDAGDAVARRLAKAGIDIREIGTIFITHHHDDHTAGLGTLMSVPAGRARA